MAEHADALAALKDRDCERELLGQLLVFPETATLYDEAGITADLFAYPEHRATWHACAAVIGEQRAPTLAAIKGWLHDHGQLDREVSLPYLASLLDGVPRFTLATVRASAGRLRMLSQGRRLIGVLDRVERGILAKPDRVASATTYLADQLADLEDRTGFAVLDEAALLALPNPPALVSGRIWLPDLALKVLFAPPGQMKTFFALGLALAVESGTPWLGSRIERAGPVLYLAGEGASGLGVRLRAWREHYQVTGGGRFHVLPHAIDLLDRGQVQQLIATARPLQPVEVMFDTLSRCLPGHDENMQDVMSAVVGHLADVQRALGCGVSVMHHANAAGTRERGSTVLRGAADAMLELSALDDRYILRCDKLKDGPAWADVALDARPVGDSLVIDLAGAARTDREPLSPHQSRALSALIDNFSRRGATRTEWQETCPSIPRTSFYRCVQRLIDLDLVTERRGKFYPAADVWTEDI